MPGQLAQVWTNLLTNAAEAMQDTGVGSTVTIRTSAPEPGWVEVDIIDDGPGIPGERLEQLFEPRFTTKNGQVRFGMGIGLSVCRSIINKHHGTIALESSPRGTQASVRLRINGPRRHHEPHHSDS